MKYLVLFEAFKSSKLSKTLNYIKDDRNFLDYIKKIANSYDFPISEFSDDMFQYLPFSSALAVKKEKDMAPYKCDYESEWIKGEFCTGGRVKRTWGKGVRIIQCPRCGGKGTLTPRVEGELKYVKFWFTAEGKLVAMTGVDGLKDERQGSPRRADLAPSQKVSDYKIGEVISRRNISDSKLKTGDTVSIEFSERGGPIIGTIYRYGSTFYFIQDKLAGSSPSGSSWRRYGNYSWSLSGNDYESVTILIPKDESEKDNANNYEWNHKIDIGRYGISVQKGYDVEQMISSAHFALILDIDVLKTSEYKKNSEIRSERNAAISGALSQLKDQQVKDANIERYIDVISKKFDIGEGFKNITRIAGRMYCGKNVLYYLYHYSSDDFASVISQIYRLIKNKDKWDKSEVEYQLNNLKDTLHSTYKHNMKLSSEYSEAMKYMKRRIHTEGRDEYNKVLDAMQKLSSLIDDKILKMEVETLEDMEIMLGKLQALRNIIKRDRYTIRKASYVFDYMRNVQNDSRKDQVYRYLVGYIEPEYIDDFVKDCEIISNIVNKM